MQFLFRALRMVNKKERLEDEPLSLYNLVGSERYMVLKVDPHDEYQDGGLITLISPGTLTIKGGTLKEVYDSLYNAELDYSPHTITHSEHNNMIEKLKVHIEKYGKLTTATEIVNNEQDK